MKIQRMNNIVGYDVADSGDDKNATTGMDGSVCVHLDEWKGGRHLALWGNQAAENQHLHAPYFA